MTDLTTIMRYLNTVYTYWPDHIEVARVEFTTWFKYCVDDELDQYQLFVVNPRDNYPRDNESMVLADLLTNLSSLDPPLILNQQDGAQYWLSWRLDTSIVNDIRVHVMLAVPLSTDRLLPGSLLTISHLNIAPEHLT